MSTNLQLTRERLATVLAGTGLTQRQAARHGTRPSESTSVRLYDGEGSC